MRQRILAALRLALDDQPVESSQLPDPWLAWLVVCLLRQTDRQRWLLRIVDERLSTSRGQEGDVPGLPGWRFFFHGSGCCLESEAEVVDVDFHDQADLTIDPYFFAGRLHGLKVPGWPEQRARALLKTVDATVLAIGELRRLGIVGHPKSQHVFRLAAPFQALEPRLVAGDFAGWCERLGDFEGIANDERATDARRARVAWLRAQLEGPRPQAAIAALALDSGDAALVADFEKLIEGPPGPGAGAAIRELAKRPDTQFCQAIPGLLRRARPAEDHPFAVFEAARYLLLRGADPELARDAVLRFGRTDTAPGHRGNPYAADFAMLALEYMPEHALELVRRALRSTVPIARTTMVAVLLLLDLPWTRQELEAAGKEPKPGALLEMEMKEHRAWAERVRPRLAQHLQE